MANIKIIGNGPNADTEAQVDPSFQAIRANLRPLEFTQQGLIGGHFFMAVTFSNTAGSPAGGSQIFSLRWGDSRLLFVLKRVTVSVAVTTAFPTAQAVDCDIIKATSFTVGASGGTAVVPATTAQKARSATMSGSLLTGPASSTGQGNIQVSSGTALTAGTQTLDTQPFGYAEILNTTTGVGTAGVNTLYQITDFGVHPMIFGLNEGFAIRNGIAMGATGVAKFGFTLEWAEVPAY